MDMAITNSSVSDRNEWILASYNSCGLDCEGQFVGRNVFLEKLLSLDSTARPCASEYFSLYRAIGKLIQDGTIPFPINKLPPPPISDSNKIEKYINYRYYTDGTNIHSQTGLSFVTLEKFIKRLECATELKGANNRLLRLKIIETAKEMSNDNRFDLRKKEILSYLAPALPPVFFTSGHTELKAGAVDDTDDPSPSSIRTCLPDHKVIQFEDSGLLKTIPIPTERNEALQEDDRVPTVAHKETRIHPDKIYPAEASPDLKSAYPISFRIPRIVSVSEPDEVAFNLLSDTSTPRETESLEKAVVFSENFGQISKPLAGLDSILGHFASSSWKNQVYGMNYMNPFQTGTRFVYGHHDMTNSDSQKLPPEPLTFLFQPTTCIDSINVADLHSMSSSIAAPNMLLEPPVELRVAPDDQLVSTGSLLQAFLFTKPFDLFPPQPLGWRLQSEGVDQFYPKLENVISIQPTETQSFSGRTCTFHWQQQESQLVGRSRVLHDQFDYGDCAETVPIGAVPSQLQSGEGYPTDVRCIAASVKQLSLYKDFSESSAPKIFPLIMKPCNKCITLMSRLDKCYSVKSGSGRMDRVTWRPENSSLGSDTVAPTSPPDATGSPDAAGSLTIFQRGYFNSFLTLENDRIFELLKSMALERADSDELFLSEVFNEFIIPFWEDGKIYRTDGNNTLLPLLVRINGHHVPICTIFCAIGYILSVHFAPRISQSPSETFPVFIIYAQWCKAISFWYYPKVVSLVTVKGYPHDFKRGDGVKLGLLLGTSKPSNMGLNAGYYDDDHNLRRLAGEMKGHRRAFLGRSFS